MTNRRELADRLEASECGSRELDAAVCDLSWNLSDGFWVYAAPVTTSVTAALALAEKAVGIAYVLDNACQTTHKAQPTAHLWNDAGKHTAHARTMPLAICAAILRARLDDEGKGGEA